MKKLTPRQNDVLEVIKTHIQCTGFPPTRIEIANELGFKSPNAAEEHIKALARKGAITIVPGASRGIQLPDQGPTGIPLIGQVAAGQPILAEENIEDYYDVSDNLFKPFADYLLRVNGMSMKNIGIIDGDLLAVHRTNTAQNGQVVVARIDDEVTVKRFKQDHQMVFLIPENEEFETIKVDLTEQPVDIEGLAVGIIRQQVSI